MPEYHGRYFVSNHCYKYLKAYDHICDSVVREIIETTDDSECHSVANDICRDFKTLNSLYYVHTQLSQAQSLTEKGYDIKDMQRSIDEYIAFFRSRFHTAHISPKQHMLDVHCVGFTQNAGFGLGLLGEQMGQCLCGDADKSELYRQVATDKVWQCLMSVLKTPALLLLKYCEMQPCPLCINIPSQLPPR